MDSITHSILQYISLPQTNYAIQITGAWGTGKTHFAKSKLKTEIENTCSNIGKNFKFCYVSLNGFSSVDQIGEAVFFEMANAKNQLAVQGLKFLGRYGSGLAGIFANVEQTVTNVTEDLITKVRSSSIDDMTQFVICFDDLERIDDSLSIKQVFGYINTNYIEHHHVKVIFVSNEEEIHDKGNYKLYREKIIGKTLKFNQSETVVLEELISNIYDRQDHFLDFFEKEKLNLMKVVNLVFNEINLRTLRFALDTFVILQSELYKFCTEENERYEISKNLFLNIIVVANEYKKGNLSAANQLSPLYGQSYFYYFPTNKDSEEDYIQILLKRYHRLDDYFDQNIYYFSSVSTYLIDGYVNNEDFKKELTTFIDKMRRENSKGLGEENPIKILKDFWMYEDERLKKAQDEVLKRIKKGSYSANEYPSLYKLFNMFIQENLLLTEEVDIEQVFENGFTKALENWVPVEELDYWEYGEVQTGEERFKKMIGRLKEKQEEIKYQERKEKVYIWLKSLAHQSVENEMYKDIEYEKDFFKILLELNFIEGFFKESNEFIIELTRYLHHKYLRIINSYEFHSHEIPFIEQLIEQIDGYLIGYDKERVKKYNIEQFRGQLVKVKLHLGKTK